MRRLVQTILLVVLFVSSSFIGVHYSSLMDVSKEENILSYLEEVKQLENVKILKTCCQDGFFAAFYDSNEGRNLIIFEEDDIFSGRYEYYGGAGGPSDFNTADFEESSRGLIIVYGDNTKIRGYSYAFSNGGTEYIKEDLGEYVLDIYVFKTTSKISSDMYLYTDQGYVYDKNGQKLAPL